MKAAMLGAALWLFSMSVAADPVREARINDARTARLAGDSRGAERILTEVVREDPTNFRALYNLALAQTAQRKFEEAKASFEDALRVTNGSPSDATIFNSYGWMLMQAGDLAGAKDQFERGLTRIDELPAASQVRLRNNVGVLYLQLDRTAAAQAQFRSIEGESDVARARLDLIRQIEGLQAAARVPDVGRQRREMR